MSRTQRIIGLLLLLLVVLITAGLILNVIVGGRSQRLAAERKLQMDALLDQVERAAGNGENEGARQLLERALQISPGNFRASLYRSLFLHEDGKSEQALTLLATIPESGGLSGATARHLEGRILLDLNRAADAERSFLNACNLNPRNPLPVGELVRLYAIQLRGPETLFRLEALQQLRRLTIAEEVMYLLAGRPIVDERQATSQLEAFLQADREDHASAAALLRYALLRSDLNRAAALTERFVHFLNTEDLHEFRGWAGVAWLEGGEFSKAAKLLPTEGTSLPWTVGDWELYARLAEHSGEWLLALSVRGYLASQNPFDIFQRHRLAEACERLDLHDEAAKHRRAVDQLDQLERLAYSMQRPQAGIPAFAVPVIEQLVHLLLELQRIGAAARWLMVGMQLNPQHTQFAIQQRRLSEAAVLAETADRIVPPDVREFRWRPDIRVSTAAPAESGLPAGSPKFVDLSAELGLDFRYFNGASSRKRIVETIGGGAGVLDYDADGWPDLYFPQGSPGTSDGHESVPGDGLYRNLRGHSFVNVAPDAGIREMRHGLGCAVGDIDNDGFSDVLLANLGRNTLYRNQGDGTFVEVEMSVLETQSDCTSAAAIADLDGDGLSDVYLVNYVEGWDRVCYDGRGEVATCDPREFRGGQDRILQNDGEGGFVDVTETAGAWRSLGDGKGLGVVVLDLNTDGLPDVYVANDGTPNFLFLNRSDSGQLRFEEQGLRSGVAVDRDGRSQAGMGIAVADFTGHGRPDLFVTNFYRESNTLYSNLGDGLFEDRTRQAGLDFPSREVLGFGAQALDANLDGYPDLLVLNGDIDDYSAMGRPWKMKPQLFCNDGRGRFQDMSATAGEFFEVPVLGRGLATFDYDRDGRADAVAIFHDRPVALLRNTADPASGFISLRIIDTVGSRDATGTHVVLVVNAKRYSFWLTAGDGLACSNQKRLILSIPQHSPVLSVEVHWPDGRRCRLDGARAGIHTTLIRRTNGRVELLPEEE